MKTTQRQNVLRTLLDSPVCGTTRDPELGIRIAARINELRHAGYWIATVPCTIHEHQSRQIQYELRSYGDAKDGCAYCGPGPFLSIELMKRISGVWFEIVACNICGKRDLR